MSFLAPLFILGSLAIALPVVFHLIRRTTREKVPFSSLMFLLPSPPRLTRRSRLEHILLLLLRCLVLCLLALGFSRPFIKKAVPPEPPSAARRILVLVDTSGSMRRANLWSDARGKADAILHSASPADQLALYTFDRQIKPLVTFDEWNASPVGERAALASRKLAEASPGWSSTHLGNALSSAAELLAEPSTANHQPATIVLITDFQEGSHLDQIQGYEWPKGIELSVETLKPKHLSNASLQLVTEADDADPKAGGTVRVRVSNAANSKLEQFKIGWAALDGRTLLANQPSTIYVPAGQSRIVALEPPRTDSTNQPSTINHQPSTIRLQGDEEDFDNTIFVVPPETARFNVVYIGADSDKDPHQPLYFLQRAFQETRHQSVEVLAQAPNQPPSSIQHPASGNALTIATDPLPDQLASALHEQVSAGKTLLFAPKTEAAGPTLARVLGLPRLNLEEAKPSSYAMLAEIDFRHPLFAAFADPRFSDFTKIHFWKYRRLDAATIPNARILAKFDSGDPALLEIPVGKGRVLILTSGWQPEDSQLALSTKFVPLLYSLLELSSPAAPVPIQYNVGDPVPLGDGQATLSGPGGIQVAPGGPREAQLFPSPGIFTLNSQPPKLFAVNLDPAESRTAPLPADELERLGAPMARASATAVNEVARKAHLQNADLENRQKLWRWFILATMALLLFETWLAGRTARRAVASMAEAS